MRFDNVYIKETATVAGHLERDGSFGKYFDKTYDDYYMDDGNSLELSETKLFKDSIDILLKKASVTKDDIDLVVAGDLQNQITASCYGVKDYDIPFLGVYAACATSMESVIIASSLLDSFKVSKVICSTCSHNLAEEKQFRNPVEYGGPKPKTATFTATGGASILLTNEKTNIKVSSATIGKIVNLGQNDVNNMGAIMAPAAADTIKRHLDFMGETKDDYDLILTGDLGIFGMEILKDYMAKVYNIKLDKNYNDCGAMLYNLKEQKEITAGGSGPVCSALVNYGYVYDMLKKGNLKRVLLCPTGALFSPIYAYQKQDILGIAHAVTIEVVR